MKSSSCHECGRSGPEHALGGAAQDCIFQPHANPSGTSERMYCPDCLHLWDDHFDVLGDPIDCGDDRPDGHVCLKDCMNHDRMPLWCVVLINWHDFKAWFRRCPECRHRPDKHDDRIAPRWEDDVPARMMGIAKYGCPRCGHGCIEERDAARCAR